MAPSLVQLAAIANGSVETLKTSGQTLACIEASSGGLISASLQAVPRASRFWQGSVNIYSAKAAAALLPREVREQLGSRRTHYSSAENYVRSKEVFTSVLAKHYRSVLGVDWVVAESGAADAQGLSTQLRAAGAFSVATVVGPDGIEASRLYRAPMNHSREENMWAFAAAALQLLEEVVCKRQSTQAASKL
eukprot:TRINITY_DN58770_c0_g1_i1.p1 TRINITY_DN58770_c0_g1~~TRINITY_DN58770_c0_g1_i1.p1  ORF type:complete len:191 (+),score=35.17 TRINITY_DN58770_c0_g1_i1:48-620(+)